MITRDTGAMEDHMENRDLVLDLVDWVAERPRAYQDVMDAWRSSCPRLTVWEDALDAGLVEMQSGSVVVSARGLDFLQANGRQRTGPRPGC